MERQEEARLTEQFLKKVTDLAREGSLGKSLRTRISDLRQSYTHWVSLLDRPDVPVLLYGEKGAGKRRHIDEYTYLHNLHLSLSTGKSGKLRVFRGDFVKPGFTQLLLPPNSRREDLLYFEAVDALDKECQEELVEFLVRRKMWTEKEIPQPRIIFGTERALSILVLKKEFEQRLFKELTAFAVFLPHLKEREDDLPHLIISIMQELTGAVQTPPVWLVDYCGQRDWHDNLDGLKRVLAAQVAKNPHMSEWKKDDLISGVEALKRALEKKYVNSDPFFSRAMPKDSTQAFQEKRKIRYALDRYKGNLGEAAVEVGLSRSDFLRKMLAYGVR
jgi:hypothetical protein